MLIDMLYWILGATAATFAWVFRKDILKSAIGPLLPPMPPSPGPAVSPVKADEYNPPTIPVVAAPPNTLVPPRPSAAEFEHTVTPEEARALLEESAQWPIVEEGGTRYAVAANYIRHMGIGEADTLVKSMPGFQLPTPELVDAIYRAADLKLPFHPQAHDGTAAQMNAPALLAKQDAFIANQVKNSPNPNYTLLAGTHKDVVRSKPEGTALAYHQKNTLGIYGAQKADGSVTQAFMWGHAHGNTPGADWKDYSQGLRLVRRIA